MRLEVNEARFSAASCGIMSSHSAKPQLVTGFDHALMLEVDPTSAVISSSYTGSS